MREILQKRYGGIDIESIKSTNPTGDDIYVMAGVSNYVPYNVNPHMGDIGLDCDGNSYVWKGANIGWVPYTNDPAVWERWKERSKIATDNALKKWFRDTPHEPQS